MTEPLVKTTNVVEGKMQAGFWLPISNIGGSLAEEQLVWCQQKDKDGDPGPYGFHGGLFLGRVDYYLAVVELMEKDGFWWAKSEGKDHHPYPHDPDLDEPHAFRIKGYEGRWIILLTPSS